MFESDRYAIHYINTALLHDGIDPPNKELAGDNIEIVETLYSISQGGGAGAVKISWGVIRKSCPQLDKPQKLFNIHQLQHIDPPAYAMPYDVDGTSPFYAIYLKGLNVLYGKPGSGKTFIALDFINRVALAHPGRAMVYTAGEGVSGLPARQQAWEQHYEQHVNNLHVYNEALPLLNPQGMDEFRFWAKDVKPVFIVIDTLARAMLGENENDTSVMGKLIAECDAIMKELDCGVLLIHHTNRMGYLRGSIALDGGADSMLKIHAEDEMHIVYNSLDHGGKNKHAEEAPAIYLKKLSVPLPGGIDGAVMVQAEQIIDDIETTRTLTDNQLSIMRVLSTIEYATWSGLAELTQLNRSTIYRNIKKLLDAGYVEKHMQEAYKITEKGKNSVA